jgi:hypothetical protein
LFTLVGIAGEDDLDAPDLCVESPAPAPSVVNGSFKPRDGQSRMPTRKSGNGRARHGQYREIPPTLRPDQSASLREKLVTELGKITSVDLASAWARGALSAKNSLVEADAKLVEDAFERHLSELSSSETAAPSNDDSSGTQTQPQKTVEAEPTDPGQAKGIDKSVLAIPIPRRYRNKEHLRYVARQPCLLCARKPSDPHHLRFMQARALGRKASDEFVVPLCRVHHREVHRAGNERAWWKQTRIDPLKVARKLWKHTRVHEGRVQPDQAPQSGASDRALESDASSVDSQAPAS